MDKVVKTHTGNSRKSSNLLIYAPNAQLALYYVTIASIVLFAIVLIVGIDLLPDYLYVVVVIFLTWAILSLYGVQLQGKSTKSWNKARNFMAATTVEISDERLMISTDDYMEANISWASLLYFSNKEKYIEIWIAGADYRINKKFLTEEETETILAILNRQMAARKASQPVVIENNQA